MPASVSDIAALHDRAGACARSLDLTQDADEFVNRAKCSGSLAAFVPLQSQKATVTLTAATVTNAFENDALGPIYADKIRTASLDFRRSPARLFSRNQLRTVNYRQGIDVLGASHRDDDYLSREGALDSFRL